MVPPCINHNSIIPTTTPTQRSILPFRITIPKLTRQVTVMANIDRGLWQRQGRRQNKILVMRFSQTAAAPELRQQHRPVSRYCTPSNPSLMICIQMLMPVYQQNAMGVQVSLYQRQQWCYDGQDDEGEGDQNAQGQQDIRLYESTGDGKIEFIFEDCFLEGVGMVEFDYLFQLIMIQLAQIPSLEVGLKGSVPLVDAEKQCAQQEKRQYAATRASDLVRR